MASWYSVLIPNLLLLLPTCKTAKSWRGDNPTCPILPRRQATETERYYTLYMLSPQKGGSATKAPPAPSVLYHVLYSNCVTRLCSPLSPPSWWSSVIAGRNHTAAVWANCGFHIKGTLLRPGDVQRIVSYINVFTHRGLQRRNLVL